MKYFVLVWAGIWRKPARTVLTSLSIATAFLLFGVLNGTMVGFDKFLERMTGDLVVLYTGSSVNAGTGLPIGARAVIERVDGVLNVDIQQNFSGYYQDPKNSIGTIAIDVDSRIKHPRPDFTVSEEALETMQRVRTGTILGRAIAEKYGLKIGDRLPLTSNTIRRDGSNLWVFDVVGIWDMNRPGYAADQIWINYDYFDEARAFGNGTVRAFVSLIADPAQAARIAGDIDAMFANSPHETHTQSFGDMIRAQLNQITDIQLIINVVLGAVLFTLLFVTGNTMLQSTVERIPELAVLKTYGYSDAVVAGLVLVESTFLCVTAALIGIVIAAGVLFPLIAIAFRIQTLPMEKSVVLEGIGIAVALACVSALPPAWRARRLNVVDALAGR